MLSLLSVFVLFIDSMPLFTLLLYYNGIHILENQEVLAYVKTGKKIVLKSNNLFREHLQVYA